MQSLKDVAKYVRSKNAGPFWVTIDIFCEDQSSYERLSQAPALAPPAIAELYNLNSNEVRTFHDATLKVIKISFPRPVVQGAGRDMDSHAGQYFVPLLSAQIA